VKTAFALKRRKKRPQMRGGKSYHYHQYTWSIPTLCGKMVDI